MRLSLTCEEKCRGGSSPHVERGTVAAHEALLDVGSGEDLKAPKEAGDLKVATAVAATELTCLC